MASMNLDSFSLSELHELDADLTRAIADFSLNKKLDALNALEARAKELGFGLSDLIPLLTQRSYVCRPKYRHPELADITWSGRGRFPGWFKKAIREGASPESMAI